MVFFHTHVVLLWRTQTSRIVRLLVTQLSCFRDYVLQRVDNDFHWQVPFNDSESNHCQPLRVIFYPFAFQRFSHFQCSSHWARNEVCPCACGCLCIAGMLFAAVDALSDEEVGVPAPVSDPGPRISKRKRRRLTKETKPSKEVDPFAQLQTILDDDCPCKQKTCSRQFLEPTMLVELSQYVREWHSLDKLDQDRIAP